MKSLRLTFKIDVTFNVDAAKEAAMRAVAEGMRLPFGVVLHDSIGESVGITVEQHIGALMVPGIQVHVHSTEYAETPLKQPPPVGAVPIIVRPSRALPGKSA